MQLWKTRMEIIPFAGQSYQDPCDFTLTVTVEHGEWKRGKVRYFRTGVGQQKRRDRWVQVVTELRASKCVLPVSHKLRPHQSIWLDELSKISRRWRAAPRISSSSRSALSAHSTRVSRDFRGVQSVASDLALHDCACVSASSASQAPPIDKA